MPAPPSSRSRPAPPSSRSAPAPPSSRSVPAWPRMWSAPAPPMPRSFPRAQADQVVPSQAAHQVVSSEGRDHVALGGAPDDVARCWCRRSWRARRRSGPSIRSAAETARRVGVVAGAAGGGRARAEDVRDGVVVLRREVVGLRLERDEPVVGGDRPRTRGAVAAGAGGSGRAAHERGRARAQVAHEDVGDGVGVVGSKSVVGPSECDPLAAVGGDREDERVGACRGARDAVGAADERRRLELEVADEDVRRRPCRPRSERLSASDTNAT